MIEVQRITNNDYNTCISCRESYNNYYMFKVVNSYLDGSYTYVNNTVYCKNCLFNLLLELNNIFELAPMLDGTDEMIREKYHNNELGIPPTVYTHLLNGKNIAAIKEYRDLGGKFQDKDTGAWYWNRGLKQCKEKIDFWKGIVKPLDRRR